MFKTICAIFYSTKILFQLKSRGVTEVFGDIIIAKVAKQPLVHLKYSVDEDYQFLNELQALKAITAKVIKYLPLHAYSLLIN